MGKKNKRQKTKEVSSVVEMEEEVKASSTGRAGDEDEGGNSYPLIAPRKRGRPRKIAVKKEEEEDDEGEMGGMRKKQQVKEEEDSTRSRARRKSIPRKSS